MGGNRPMPEFHQMRTEIPRGFAAYWQIIRRLDAEGPWNIPMVAGETRSHNEVVGRYVRRLLKGGFTEVVGQVKYQNKVSPMYRLLKRPSDAPRLRDDGSECPPTAQEQMWRAMRSLTQFDAAELAYAASTDVVVVDVEAAKGYISRLYPAGYLVEVKPGKRTKTGYHLAVWRLRPAMNTGPIAPMVMHTRLVWDANRNEVMGTSVATEGSAR